MIGWTGCPTCGGSGVEQVYAGHGNVNEYVCDAAPPTIRVQRRGAVEDAQSVARFLAHFEAMSPHSSFGSIRADEAFAAFCRLLGVPTYEVRMRLLGRKGAMRRADRDAYERGIARAQR